VPEWRTRAQVPADHPCLPGHFPGNPVVPAVVLLEQVLAALRLWRGAHWQLRRLVTAKFLVPLRPDERFEIVLQMADASPGSQLQWRCERDAQVLAQGRWEVSP
jgi:3-hydroxymyristoyl/3-hydroxydecanoyl-(acyl carrier protein) dehydratase